MKVKTHLETSANRMFFHSVYPPDDLADPRKTQLPSTPMYVSLSSHSIFVSITPQ